MKVKISISYENLQKVLKESATLRSLMGSEDELRNFYNRFLSDNNISYIGNAYRIPFIKKLRDECKTNERLFDQLHKEGHEFVTTVSLAAAKRISDQFD